MFLGSAKRRFSVPAIFLIRFPLWRGQGRTAPAKRVALTPPERKATLDGPGG